MLKEVYLGRQWLLHILLNSAYDKRLKLLVQLRIPFLCCIFMFFLKFFPWSKSNKKIKKSWWSERSRILAKHCLSNLSCISWHFFHTLANKKHTYLLGIMKCSRLHSSFRLFCKGVPVISKRWFVSNSINALYKRESSFFRRWASSTSNAAQLRLPRSALSFKTIS